MVTYVKDDSTFLRHVAAMFINKHGVMPSSKYAQRLLAMADALERAPVCPACQKADAR